MGRLRRRRDGSDALALKLSSLMLSYPDEDVLDARGELARHVPEAQPAGAQQELASFCEWWTATPALAVQQHYVQTFDLDKRCGLYMTFYAEGDKRSRGATLLRLKQMYRAAGLPLTEGELPDYLPAMLEFAADAPDGHGKLMLREQRAAIEFLRLSLHDRGTAYAHVLEAVHHVLGDVSAVERAKVLAIASSGPPQELVGLEPFAPPEVMPAVGARR